MKGYHSVLSNEGIDIEKALLGYNDKPVNITELFRIAKHEGFILTTDGVWVHIDTSENDDKPKHITRNPHIQLI